jgi:hypothetical protein
MRSGVLEILEQIRSDRAPSDRRRHPRVGLRARVKLEPIDRHQRRGPARQAWLRDVSEGGAGLLVNEELRAGQSVMLHVPLTEDCTMPVRCRVVHCTKTGRFWRAGLEFTHKPWREPKPTVLPGRHGVEGEIQRISDAMAT